MMLRINNLYKSLGQKQILNNLSLHAKEGSIYGLVGPNGAGKTTLIRTIAGILIPDRGEILINNMPLTVDNVECKKRLGYVTDSPLYFPQYRIKELYKMYKSIYQSFSDERYNKLLRVFDLNPNARMKHLSKGMKTRVSLLLNLAIMPNLLLLDEPTSGLDPVIRQELLNILIEEASEYGTTLFISTHNLDELERICDYIGLIHQGRILTESELDTLKEKIRKVQIVLNDELPAELKNHPDILNIEQAGRVYRIIVRQNFEQIIAIAKKYNPLVLETIDMSLNEIFINQLGGEGYVIKK